jgi:Domain of unknown function (DUF4145)
VSPLIGLLLQSTRELWRWYTPQLMEIVNFQQENFGHIGARGICPHCAFRSYFRPVTGAHREPDARQEQRHWICNGAQCESCKGFVLVVGDKFGAHHQAWRFQAVYPLGKPNDSVAPEVPQLIADDFREGLRCEWVEAYKAAVTMCRRALQASCVELKAKDAKLRDQIDELASKGVITQSLKDMAHEVRLTGNDGAHPGKDGLNDVTPQDARDMIEFTREFFHHVFVVPAKLKARQVPPPAAAAPTSP